VGNYQNRQPPQLLAPPLPPIYATLLLLNSLVNRCPIYPFCRVVDITKKPLDFIIPAYNNYPYQAQGLKEKGKKMAKLTKADQVKVSEVITSIYSGVAIALDPTEKEIYNKITNRLREDLKDLKTVLELN